MRAKKVAGGESKHGFREPKRDAFTDVKAACNRFLRDRIARGEMKDFTGLMKNHPTRTP